MIATGILHHDFVSKKTKVIDLIVNKRNAEYELEALVMDFIQKKDGVQAGKELIVYNKTPSMTKSQKVFVDILNDLPAGHYVVRDAELYPNTLEVWEKIVQKVPGFLKTYKTHSSKPIFSVSLIEMQPVNYVNIVPLTDSEYYDDETCDLDEFAHWKVSMDEISKSEIFKRIRTMTKNDQPVDILKLRGNFSSSFVKCSMAKLPVPKKEREGHDAVLDELRKKHKEMTALNKSV